MERFGLEKVIRNLGNSLTMIKNPRKLFIAVVGFILFSIIYGSVVRNVVLFDAKGNNSNNFFRNVVNSAVQIPSQVKRSFDRPEFLIENSTSADGLSIREGAESRSGWSKMLFTYKTGSFEQKVDLLDLRSGEVLKTWEPDNKKLYKAAYNVKNPNNPPKGSDLYSLHPLMLNDSSLIMAVQLSSILARIDKNGDFMWTKSDQVYHHTLELGPDGYLYSCTRPFSANSYDFLSDNYDQYESILLDDAISKVDINTGNTEWSRPVIDILLDNGYGDLIINKGQVISDPIHLNDIQPVFEDSELWNKGDLFISCRNINVVFLYRPLTNKILWLKEGPWMNQHDIDVVDDETIMIFGNDIIREESVNEDKLTNENLFFSKKQPHNEIYLYNVIKDSVWTPYTALLKNEQISTRTSGRCDLLPNGDLMVEDTNNGRILILDSVRVKAELTKRIDNKYISSLFWSRILK